MSNFPFSLGTQFLYLQFNLLLLILSIIIFFLSVLFFTMLSVFYDHINILCSSSLTELSLFLNTHDQPCLENN